MTSGTLAKKVRKHLDADHTILVYVPCPLYRGVNGRAGGFVRASTLDILTLLENGNQNLNLEVDVTEGSRSLMATIEGLEN